MSTKEEALKAIRESAMGFYVVAGIQAFASLWLGLSALIDAALFATLGFWLQKSRSRLPATLLAILGAVSIGTTFWNQVTGALGGRNVVLSLIVFWAALRAAIATYKLPVLVSQDDTEQMAGSQGAAPDVARGAPAP